MVLLRDWLWDRKFSVKQAQAILKDPDNKRFFVLSALLLSRKNTPKEVLRHYLKPELFIRYWMKIKRQMRKDAWNNPRIEFWQEIYETLKRKYEKRGIAFPNENISQKPRDAFCKEIANKIKIVFCREWYWYRRYQKFASGT